MSRLKSSRLCGETENLREGPSIKKHFGRDTSRICLNKQPSGAVYRVSRKRFSRSRRVRVLIRRIPFEHTLYDLQNTHQTVTANDRRVGESRKRKQVIYIFFFFYRKYRLKENSPPVSVEIFERLCVGRFNRISEENQSPKRRLTYTATGRVLLECDFFSLENCVFRVEPIARYPKCLSVECNHAKNRN